VREYRREIDIITRNASRLQNLAESILQVSRIESGTFSLSIQGSVDIHALIEQAIDDVEKKYAYTDKAGKVSIEFMPLFLGNGKKGKVDNSVEADMDIGRDNGESNSKSNGNTARPVYVDCDPQKIAQVIFNLLDNAMKFTDDGKVFVSTSSAISQNSSTAYDNGLPIIPKVNRTSNSKPLDDMENNEGILVTVQDTGIGVNSQIKDQLFEKFATKSRQGTGLGLYLSKKIIEAHGGHIWHEDQSDRYSKYGDVMEMANSKKTETTFKFVIPAAISKRQHQNQQMQHNENQRLGKGT
jgi:signal transduction histidine kinase